MKNYDGSGKLSDAITDLCISSGVNDSQSSVLIKQAKSKLGITGKARQLPDDVNRAIYEWIYQQFIYLKIIKKPVKKDSQTKSTQEFVDINSQPETAQPTPAQRPVEINSQYSDSALVRVGFYIHRQNVKIRQVIALDGFYVNALMLAVGISKSDVPKWVQLAVDSWEGFNPELPITKQVKFLLIRELTKHFK